MKPCTRHLRTNLASQVKTKLSTVNVNKIIRFRMSLMPT